MEMYELMAAGPVRERAYSPDGPPDLEETKSVLHLPEVYCTTCRKRYAADGFSLFEARVLPSDHPAIVELKTVNAAIRRESRKVQDELAAMMGGFIDNVPPDHPIWERWNASGGVSGQEFWRIAERLREALSLPVTHPIMPGERLGELEVNCTRSRISDLILGPIDGLPVVVTGKTIEVLKAAGCTGFNVYPVNVARTRGNKPIPPLFELEIVGRGGLPGAGSSPWEMIECPVCLLTSVTGPMDGRYVLDPAQHDGSDIFCFDRWRFVFVTRRFKEAIENANLTGAQFRPSTIPKKEWRERAH